VNPRAGRPGQVVEMNTCISKWLRSRMERVKEVAKPRYDRFYPIRDLQPPIPSARTFKEICGGFETAVFRDARAIWDIFATEASSAHAPFLEFYMNATHDLIEDNFKRDLELVKHLLKEYEKEYAAREKLIITESGKHIYIKKQDNKIMLSGDTFSVKDEIKKRGFKWDPLYKVWYAPANNVDLGKLKREIEAL
jgi:hypothetical protein